MIYKAIVFLPAIGALIAGLLGRVLGPRPCGSSPLCLVGAGAILSWIALWQVGLAARGVAHSRAALGTSGELDVSGHCAYDTLTAVMLVVVNYRVGPRPPLSIGYMHEDDSRPRFFAYLSLFTFAMLALVTSGGSCSCSSAGRAWASPPTC